MGVSSFTSDQARSTFTLAYDEAMQRLWPAGWTSTDITTAYGPTRVNRFGPADGVPVVLLPGAAGNSLMWYRYVADLGRDHQVLAVDPVGEPGGSRQDKPIDTADDLTEWLGEVFTGLGVAQAHLIGCSYGGWTAMQYALRHPDRVATMTLLDPAGFGKVGGRFLAWVILGGLAGLAPRGVRHRAARWLRNATLLDDDLMGMARVSMSFRRRLPVPPSSTDDELRTSSTPALVLLGANSQLYDAASVAQRLRTVGSFHVDVVPDAGHDLPVSCPSLVVERSLAFLARTSSRAA
ncbi:pimeloyl-ACP methyl ester carboxylesterase [Hamadaea flava]|uniref:Alpha/beta fold hydrolase n=1 Tax=Hamadaea flava TaxID=1742688 RepID=A0ABV8LTU2_9ACTN|nr:alpha/beta hydrolase [Hamadaea flava]MCP2328360.1 pimeloyl-ACP methyl ester carboxylesterase [Hamadaea flava]